MLRMDRPGRAETRAGPGEKAAAGRPLTRASSGFSFSAKPLGLGAESGAVAHSVFTGPVGRALAPLRRHRLACRGLPLGQLGGGASSRRWEARDPRASVLARHFADPVPVGGVRHAGRA